MEKHSGEPQGVPSNSNEFSLSEINGSPGAIYAEMGGRSGAEGGGCCHSGGGRGFSGSGAVTTKTDTSEEFVYGIRTDEEGKVVDFFWNLIEMRVGDKCVVENHDGKMFGVVEFARRPASTSCCEKKRMGKLLRKAEAQDIETAKSVARKEASAKIYCKERIMDRELKMNLTCVQYAFDSSKVIFFFTADNRVDFRELVKDLVNHTRAKVEMRQIGVRDEAKMLGGCGPCGAELCCSVFLTDFAPVSIKMAKNQNLSLNPAKISGVCGRLMCCLAYENSHYVELQKSAPKLGKNVKTPEGDYGKVIQLNLLKEKALVLMEDDSKQEFNTFDLERAIGGIPSLKDRPRKPKVEKERLDTTASRGDRTTDKRDKRPGKPRSSEIRRDASEKLVGDKPKRSRRRRPRRKKLDQAQGHGEARRRQSPPAEAKAKPEQERKRIDRKSREPGERERGASGQRRTARTRNRGGKRRKDSRPGGDNE